MVLARSMVLAQGKTFGPKEVSWRVPPAAGCPGQLEILPAQCSFDCCPSNQKSYVRIVSLMTFAVS
jgi:hypothetical protein